MLGKLLLALWLALVSMLAHADINVGVILSLTGPAASLGIPEKNALTLAPKLVAGEKINLIILDDASDPTNAVTNAKKLVGVDKADVILGTTTTGAALAMIETIYEGKTPTISLASSSRVTGPMDEKRYWMFKTIQNEADMAELTADHMRRNGVKKLGFIGFSDAYGDSWADSMTKACAAAGVELVGIERYGRTDTSVTAQILKIMSLKPDAVFVAGSGTPAALPQKTMAERGFKVPVYQTYGIANNDFLRVAGKDAEGSMFAIAPFLVADQLADSHPAKKNALDLIARYESGFGAGSASIFASNAWDAWILVERAIPVALKTAKPGTPEFRKALRDAIESARETVTTQGVINMTPTDHVGYDQRARVMVKVKDGKWQLVK
ncbi:MAG: ABC transporter substrate-binding protein [Proteobacteria bacterium]|nr:ABC transporter substrate-binding protein [Pseudomonadota bacterium]